MLQEKSENMSAKEVEEFASNYKIGEKNIFKLIMIILKLRIFSKL